MWKEHPSQCVILEIYFKHAHTKAYIIMIWNKSYLFRLTSNLYYKSHLSRQQNCRPIRCSWSIVCRRCSNHILILDLTPDFYRLGKDNCKTRLETFSFGDLVRLIFEVWWYIITEPYMMTSSNGNIFRVTGGALMFSLICARIHGWVNAGEAGDSSRHRAHYDVIVMVESRVSLTYCMKTTPQKCDLQLI